MYTNTLVVVMDKNNASWLVNSLKFIGDRITSYKCENKSQHELLSMAKNWKPYKTVE